MQLLLVTVMTEMLARTMGSTRAPVFKRKNN